MYKITKVLNIVFFIFFVFGFFYVKNTLSTDEISVETRKKAKEETAVHPASVTLNVQTSRESVTYRTLLDTGSSINDLLERIRANEDFTYEKYAYINGIELDYVLGVKADVGEKWNLYEIDKSGNKMQITFDSDYYLKDEYTYLLILEDKS